LLYLPRNMRSHRLYGFSPVEQIVLTINFALRREQATLDYDYAPSRIPAPRCRQNSQSIRKPLPLFSDFFPFEYSFPTRPTLPATIRLPNCPLARLSPALFIPTTIPNRRVF